MMNLKEERDLKLEGFEFVEDEGVEGEYYEKDSWVIYKDREYVRELWNAYDNGSRICMMTKNRKGSYMLFNVEDDGTWVCSSLKGCFNIMKLELEDSENGVE